MDGKSGDDGAGEPGWVEWEECEGEWLGWSWRNEAQVDSKDPDIHQSDIHAYQSEWFVILREEDVTA